MIFNYGRSGGGAKFEYTGDYTTEDYTGTDGTRYKLYTLTGSGVVTAEAKSADIWMCGGGSNGISPTAWGGTNGGAGAYCTSIQGLPISGEYVVTIGAGNGGVTSFGSMLSVNGVQNSNNGGTGGGENGAKWGSEVVGQGDGKSKYPFLDSAHFKCHCAGGGGGCHRRDGGTDNRFTSSGGKGGTNGGNGSFGVDGSEYSTPTPGAGGEYGGGAGGALGSRGKDATFYGSGGGGGANVYSGTLYAGGAGYQGVVYVRIPA